MNRFIGVLGRLFLAVLTIMLIGYCWAFFEIKIMLKDNPEFFGFAFRIQDTNELAPAIKKGDIAIIHKGTAYNEGDMVMYVSQKRKYDIKYVKSTSDISTTLLCESCPIIDNNNVLGRVVGKIRYLGIFIKFFKQKAILISVAIMGFILVTVSQILDAKPKRVNES